MIRTLRNFLASLPLLATRARLALLLHVAQLLLAAVVLLPLTRAFEATFGRSVAGAETSAGRFLEHAWQDLRIAGGELLAQAERAFSGVALLGLFVSFTLLSAGTFALLAPPGTERPRSSVREFLAGAGRLFARFARLFVLFAAGCVALFWANRGLTQGVNWLVRDALDRASPSRYVAALLHAKTLIALLLLAWLVAATGRAKARAAVRDQSSMVRAWLSSWREVLSRPFSSALLAALGPLMLGALVVVYAWTRDLLGTGATTRIGSFDAPTWIVYALLTQILGWLMQGTTVVWTHCFVLAERDAVARQAAKSAQAAQPAPGASTLPAFGVPATGLVVLFAATAAGARAQQQEGQALLPAGPFNNAYRIEALLDPRAKTVTGSETITFTNLGEKPVSELRLHLYMNAFRGPESVFVREQRLRIGKDPLAGVEASSLGNCTVTKVALAGRPLDFVVDDTVMRVALPEPVVKGARIDVAIDFSTKFAAIEVAGRGGFCGEHFGGMQWYPKLGVLRDGVFDCEPFHADTEFFADFGSYDVTLVTPKRFVVGATGKLVEREDVPSSGEPTERSEPLERRRYVASAVHDFAWCADPHFKTFERPFRYPSHTVAVTYLCQPYAVEKKDLVLAMVERCLSLYGDWFAPYPYATLTVDGVPMGVGGGMEYPTLFTISQGFPNHLRAIVHGTEEPAGVTAHEFGHQYWYGLLASDEFREAWLDEGVNTYVTCKVEEDFWKERTSPGRALQGAEWSQVVRPFLNGGAGLGARIADRDLGLAALIGFESSPFTAVRRGRRGDPTLLGFSLPVGRKPGFGEIRVLSRRDGFVPVAGSAALADVSFDLVPGAYAPTVYSKAALALATLEAVFGWDAVRAALKEHVRRHRFTHPTGEQFLAVLREVIPQHASGKGADAAHVGRKLDRFLRELWKTSSVLDLAVTEARSRKVENAEAPSFRTEVVVQNHGTMKLPANIRLRFADGHDETVPWPPDRRFLTIDRLTPSRLVSAEVDPEHQLLIDVDWSNNGRTVDRNDDLVRRFGAAALFWIETALTTLRTLSGP